VFAGDWVKTYDLNQPRTFGLEVRYKFFQAAPPKVIWRPGLNQ